MIQWLFEQLRSLQQHMTDDRQSICIIQFNQVSANRKTRLPPCSAINKQGGAVLACYVVYTTCVIQILAAEIYAE